MRDKKKGREGKGKGYTGYSIRLIIRPKGGIYDHNMEKKTTLLAIHWDEYIAKMGGITEGSQSSFNASELARYAIWRL